ncbi:hypothetical protein LK12_18055 [Novosphingobium malaysiense]|uniref:Flavin reductase like domain-containing protein n=2 Tax=Novosphingobium malaysiense TaxID=1348853 RepID=A0A0B1ZG33_9SPHN|nr:hypothetical protein LK12_18055 [Novosphingobium malaysiense]
MFRQSMRRLASSVSVVACLADGEWVGMSATSVTSLTMDPPALLVCVNKQASMAAHLTLGMHFSVNLLNREHEGLSAAFGSSKLRAERFKDGGWAAGSSGVPVMGEALAAIECTVDKMVEYGSHVIVIGRVEEVRMGNEAHPLVYFDGKYR